MDSAAVPVLDQTALSKTKYTNVMTAIYDRRRLLQGAAAAALTRSAQSAPETKMRLGIVTGISSDPEAAIKRVHDLGFPTCQLGFRSLDDAVVSKLRDALSKYNVEVTSAIAGGPPPEIYDFYKGPLTIGVAPRQYREARIARIKQVSDFAKKAGIPGVQTHCGFIPENPIHGNRQRHPNRGAIL